MSKEQWIDIDVSIDSGDVIEFIEDYASPNDLDEIRETLGVKTPLPTGTMVDIMKLDLFKKASDKYSLEELEEMLNLKYI